mgnify:CR=1 FL=1
MDDEAEAFRGSRAMAPRVSYDEDFPEAFNENRSIFKENEGKFKEVHQDFNENRGAFNKFTLISGRSKKFSNQPRTRCLCMIWRNPYR